MRELIASYTRKDFRMDTFCTGGPGGQNQNKNQNGVRFTHLATGLSAESREHKSYLQNRKAAFDKLGARLAAYHRTQLAQRPERSHETIRSYHEPDDRIVDHASGQRMSYRQAFKDLTPMIEARRQV